MKLSQKLGLAAFLCLSVSMIAMAIVRVSGLYFRGKFDSPWIVMWQQIEACVAVTMLSLTSFRVIFVGPNPGPDKAHHWIPSTRRILAKQKKGTSADQCLDDSPIPSATLTGVSSFFDRSRAAKSSDESTISDTWPLSDRQEESAGHV